MKTNKQNLKQNDLYEFLNSKNKPLHKDIHQVADQLQQALARLRQINQQNQD